MEVRYSPGWLIFIYVYIYANKIYEYDPSQLSIFRTPWRRDLNATFKGVSLNCGSRASHLENMFDFIF